MHRNVLHREGKFDGQTTEFHHLAQAEPNGDCPDVRRRRVPVHQDITRVEGVPTLAPEDRGDGFQVHLVGIGPAVFPGKGEPLLWEHADEVLLREVTRYESRAELPLPLTGEV